jgi:UDP-2,3-diacylglucosamine hydrolase
MNRVALIAGAGGLPVELAATLDGPPLVCVPEGVEPEGLGVDLVFSFERLVPFLRHLAGQGIDTVALAGAVHRPRLDPSRFDPETAALVPGLMAAMQGGDDATLRWIIALIEDFGLTVAGIADLAPSLLIGEGVATARGPTVAERADAARGAAILNALAPVDVGQGCTVASGLCLGIEALYGTDALLGDLAMHRTDREPQTGGVFVKRAKAGQDLRADLPTIGPDTVARVVRGRLSGICLQAGRVVILQRDQTLAAADAAGLALWAVP